MSQDGFSSILGSHSISNSADSTISDTKKFSSDSFATKNSAAPGKDAATGGEKTLEEFTLFPKLSIELREMIWAAVCFIPRIIHVQQEDGILVESENISGEACEYICHAQFPAILCVSKESRAIGLKYYHLDFATSYMWEDEGKTQTEDDARTFINWKCDIICLGGLYNLDSTDKLWTKLAQHFPLPGLAFMDSHICCWYPLMEAPKDINKVAKEIIIYREPVFYTECILQGFKFSIEFTPAREDIGRNVSQLFRSDALSDLEDSRDFFLKSPQVFENQPQVTIAWMRMYPLKLSRSSGYAWEHPIEAAMEGWPVEIDKGKETHIV